MNINKLVIPFFLVLTLVLVNSCGTKTTTTDYGEIALLSPKKIVEETQTRFVEPKYMSATLKIKYKSKSSKNSFTAYLRLEKDKKIWLNISFLGISFARGIITPEGVSMYERQNKSFFKGDFAYLSKLLGAELDFYQLQSLFLGQPIHDINSRKYKTLISKNSYLLEYNNNRKLSKSGVNNGDYIKRYWYNPINFELERQVLALPDRSSTLMVENSNFKLVNGKYKIPGDIHLQIVDESVTLVDIEYKGIRVGNKLSFPFRIPKGYKELKLK